MFTQFRCDKRDNADGSANITLCRFCAAAQMEMAVRVIESLAAELAVSERVLLLDETIIEALHYLDRTLMLILLIAQAAREDLGRQSTHHFFPASHFVANTDPFTGEPAV